MTDKKHRHGSGFWQIIFPISISAILLILVGIWFVLYASPGDISRFAEISTVLLVVPVYIVALVTALVLVGLIYLVVKIMDWIPRVTNAVLEFLEKIRQAVGLVSKATASLVIEPISFLASLRRRKPSASQEIKINE